MTRWLLFAWLGMAVGARAAEAGPALAAAGVVEFTAAYQAWDAERFGTAAGWFRQAATNPPPTALYFYWQGAAHFHQMLQLRSLPESAERALQAEAAWDAAVAALHRAVQLDPRHAESHALLGTLYGMKIDGHLVRALRFGPRVERHRRRALEFGADNPRVLYLLGVCQFHTAKNSAALQEALRTLRRAETQFAAEALRPAGPLEPRWGESSCLTFLGRTLERIGQPAEAEVYYQKALERHPADAMARAGLDRVRSKP